MLNVCVVGYGARINGIVKGLIKTGKVRLTAIMDIDNETAKKRFLSDEEFKDVRYYDDAEKMAETEKPDGILIGTRCNLHTHYAVMLAKYNIPMFLEKPVAITDEDIEKLKTIKGMNDKVVVSFPLRLSRLVTYTKELIDAGRLGEITQVQAYNNVPYGRGYFHKWYKDDSITGGLFLQKATHDLDYVNYLLGGDKPVRVCAMKSKQIFKGEKPAGLKCADCPDTATCPESPENITKGGDKYQLGEWCCFAKDVGNEDSGTAIVEYQSGLHVVYTQNFIARKGAGKRGARLIGFKATAEFDWYTEEVVVYHHFENIVERHKFSEDEGGHFGGDDLLRQNFIAVMEGTDVSHATLEEGILSAKLCLRCKQSAEQKKFFDL